MFPDVKFYCLLTMRQLNRKKKLKKTTADTVTVKPHPVYSIISTAQSNGLDVEHYLTELFSQLAGTTVLP